MILNASLVQGLAVTRRLAGAVVIVGASLFVIGIIALMHEYALIIGLLAVISGLTAWRPRYGISAMLILSIGTESIPLGPFMYWGWVLHSNISSWSTFQFVSFSPIELIVIVTLLVVLVRALMEGQPLRSPQYGWLLALFLVHIIVSIGWGVSRGGILNIALWETRNLFIMGIIAFLVPNVFTNRGEVHQCINLLCIAIVVLSVEIIWRNFAVIPDGASKDLSFGHDAPVFMDFAVILFLARWIWPATAAQRWTVVLVPLLLYAQMLTERRAGWVSLDIGLALLAIFVFRLRRKIFFYAVLPILLVYAGYLVTFWNAEGPIAQPARAVRSINNPEGRDVTSNQYRVYERGNIRQNIMDQRFSGLGFGQQFTFYYPMADLSWWPFWRYIPHNTVLWVWMKMGPLGFIVFLSLIYATMVRGVQLLKQASQDYAAPYLAATVAVVLMLMVFSFVDLGLTADRPTGLLGFAIGMIGTWSRLTPAEEGGV